MAFIGLTDERTTAHDVRDTKDMRLLEKLFSQPQMSSQSSDEHVSSEDLAAYLSRALSSAEKAGVERHLAECESCRRELANAQDFLSRRQRPMKLGAAAAFAAIAIVAIVMLRSPTTTIDESIPRSRGSAESTRFSAIDPAEGDTIADSAVVFRWSRQDDARYRVTLLTDTGEKVWSSETTATTLRVPDSIRLQAHSAYVWYVDALESSGDSLSLGPTQFRTR